MQTGGPITTPSCYASAYGAPLVGPQLQDDNVNDDNPYDMFHVLDRGNSLSSLEGCPVGRTSLSLLNERRRCRAHTNQGPQKTKVQNLPSPSQEAPTPIKLRKRDKLKSLFIRDNR